MLLLALYTSGQLILLLQYWKRRHHQPTLPHIESLPTVTVQLPIYNEQHVVKRLLEAVAALEYPLEKLSIQVLDDSTDSTQILIAAQVDHLQQQGLHITHVRRQAREGFKAGALAFGLEQINSELVAVLDADFVPAPDFLQKTVPYLVANPEIGVVQTRWGHLNAGENWLTQAQMLSIDAHFIIEQTARNRAGWFIPFNGTGGVWRTACIHEAGDWSGETLTEDLDLSYRAQLIGWQSLFLPDVVVPGELPPQLAAYKQQQARWATGNTQCLVRFVRPIWRSPRSWLQRVMAMQHLSQYLPHPLMLLILLLTPPLMLAGTLEHLALAPLGLVGIAPPLLYLVSQRSLYADWKRRLLAFPVLVLLGTGITWNNTRAVFYAFTDRHTEFRRTPKFVQGWTSSEYALKGNPSTIIELVLAVYALWGAVLAWHVQPALVIYLLIYAASFATVAFWSFWEGWQLRRESLADYHDTRLAKE